MVLEVMLQGIEGDFAHRHHPCFSAFAHDGHEPPAKVDCSHPQAHQFTDPQPSSIHQPEHRPVTSPPRCRAIRHVEQTIDFVFIEIMGEFSTYSWAVQKSAGVDLQHPLTQEETAKAPGSREVTSSRSRPYSLLPEFHEIHRQQGSIETSRVIHALSLGQVEQLGQVPGISLDRIFRQGPLDSQVVEESIDPCMQVHLLAPMSKGYEKTLEIEPSDEGLKLFFG
jgi:hypothetical protein